jgi:sulfur carrier protein
MQIIVNGQRRECAPASLAEVWRQEIQDAAQDGEAQAGVLNEPRGYAIALNGAVVRRDAWWQTPVSDGDQIEIVRAMQGG